jgi:hypothetical protein
MQTYVCMLPTLSMPARGPSQTALLVHWLQHTLPMPLIAPAAQCILQPTRLERASSELGGAAFQQRSRQRLAGASSLILLLSTICGVDSHGTKRLPHLRKLQILIKQRILLQVVPLKTIHNLPAIKSFLTSKLDPKQHSSTMLKSKTIDLEKPDADKQVRGANLS